MILLIDNYDSFTYNLYQMLAQYNAEVKVVRNDKITIAEIEALNPKAIILSPGPGHPREAGICIDVIKQFSGHLPILGVCLGHQAIVDAFGGTVVSADELMHGKSCQVYHEGQGIFSHMPVPFEAGRYHSLTAEKSTLPDILRIDAYALPDVIMSVHHKHHLTVGVQFHPESILTPEGYVLIGTFLEYAGIAPC